MLPAFVFLCEHMSHAQCSFNQHTADLMRRCNELPRLTMRMSLTENDEDERRGGARRGRSAPAEQLLICGDSKGTVYVYQLLVCARLVFHRAMHHPAFPPFITLCQRCSPLSSIASHIGWQGCHSTVILPSPDRRIQPSAVDGCVDSQAQRLACIGLVSSPSTRSPLHTTCHIHNSCRHRSAVWPLTVVDRCVVVSSAGVRLLVD